MSFYFFLYFINCKLEILDSTSIIFDVGIENIIRCYHKIKVSTPRNLDKPNLVFNLIDIDDRVFWISCRSFFDDRKGRIMSSGEVLIHYFYKDQEADVAVIVVMLEVELYFTNEPTFLDTIPLPKEKRKSVFK